MSDGSPPSFMLEILTNSLPAKLLTLAIVNKDGKLLLGEKKRGFGAGYINGFGGKVEPGEMIAEAAARELFEEACITPLAMEHQGCLTFIFDDQPRRWEVHVFNVSDYSGTPAETEEMRPLLVSPETIPFDRMWADDVHWYPLFLEGRKFKGIFAFNNTTQLVWHLLKAVDSLQQSPDWADTLLAATVAAHGSTADDAITYYNAHETLVHDDVGMHHST